MECTCVWYSIYVRTCTYVCTYVHKHTTTTTLTSHRTYVHTYMGRLDRVHNTCERAILLQKDSNSKLHTVQLELTYLHLRFQVASPSTVVFLLKQICNYSTVNYTTAPSIIQFPRFIPNSIQDGCVRISEVWLYTHLLSSTRMKHDWSWWISGAHSHVCVCVCAYHMRLHVYLCVHMCFQTIVSQKEVLWTLDILISRM